MMFQPEMRDTAESTIQLRSKGVVPGVIYGPGIKKSIPIQCSKKQMIKLLHGRENVLDVSIRNKGDYMVKLDEIQRDPVTKEIKHFAAMRLPKGEENVVTVPVTFIGTPAGNKEGGLLVKRRTILPLKGRPKDIPNTIEVDVSNMHVGDTLKVGDLHIPKGVECQEDPEKAVAFCQPPKSEAELTEETTPTEESETELTEDSPINETPETTT